MLVYIILFYYNAQCKAHKRKYSAIVCCPQFVMPYQGCITVLYNW